MEGACQRCYRVSNIEVCDRERATWMKVIGKVSATYQAMSTYEVKESPFVMRER